MLWCHGRNEGKVTAPAAGSPPQESSTSGTPPLPASDGAQTSGLKRSGLGFLIAGGVAVAPHALCLLGLGTLGVGSYFGIDALCSHADPKPSSEIKLTRLPKVPENYKEFTDAAAAQAAARLLDAQPGFHEVIAAKSQEANGATIQIVFLEEDASGRAVVGFCKDGLVCPCSKPQFFDLGHKDELFGTEKFPGHHHVLRALYNPDGSRR